MRRFLLITGIIPALLLSGWSSVLASALCPHAGGDAATAVASASAGEMPDCCRGETGTDESCPMSREESAEESEDSHGDSHEATVHAETTEANGEAAMTTPRAVESAGAFSHPAISCAHCIGDSNLPPAPLFVREAAPAPRDAHDRAPRAPKPLALPAASFFPSVIPSQGAPPGHARRHILISVFLI